MKAVRNLSGRIVLVVRRGRAREKLNASGCRITVAVTSRDQNQSRHQALDAVTNALPTAMIRAAEPCHADTMVTIRRDIRSGMLNQKIEHAAIVQGERGALANVDQLARLHNPFRRVSLLESATHDDDDLS